MKAKHRNDKNHGKNGYVGGNPRYSGGRGNWKGLKAADRQQTRKEINAG